MADEKKEPCGNEQCDACYPMPRWKVQAITVRRLAHEREIKAATAEDALREYARGTAWPSSYDEHTLETLDEQEPTAAQIIDEDTLSFHRTETCWHRHRSQTNTSIDSEED